MTLLSSVALKTFPWTSIFIFCTESPSTRGACRELQLTYKKPRQKEPHASNDRPGNKSSGERALKKHASQVESSYFSHRAEKRSSWGSLGVSEELCIIWTQIQTQSPQGNSPWITWGGKNTFDHWMAKNKE